MVNSGELMFVHVYISGSIVLQTLSGCGHDLENVSLLYIPARFDILVEDNQDIT